MDSNIISPNNKWVENLKHVDNPNAQNYYNIWILLITHDRICVTIGWTNKTGRTVRNKNRQSCWRCLWWGQQRNFIQKTFIPSCIQWRSQTIHRNNQRNHGRTKKTQRKQCLLPERYLWFFRQSYAHSQVSRFVDKVIGNDTLVKLNHFITISNFNWNGVYSNNTKKIEKYWGE